MGGWGSMVHAFVRHDFKPWLLHFVIYFISAFGAMLRGLRQWCQWRDCLVRRKRFFSPSIKYMAAAGFHFCSVYQSCISVMCAFSLCFAPFCNRGKELSNLPTYCFPSYARWLGNGKHCHFYQGWYIALLPWQKQWVKAQFLRLNSCSYLLLLFSLWSTVERQWLSLFFFALLARPISRRVMPAQCL